MIIIAKLENTKYIDTFFPSNRTALLFFLDLYLKSILGVCRRYKGVDPIEILALSIEAARQTVGSDSFQNEKATAAPVLPNCATIICVSAPIVYLIIHALLRCFIFHIIKKSFCWVQLKKISFFYNGLQLANSITIKRNFKD